MPTPKQAATNATIAMPELTPSCIEHDASVAAAQTTTMPSTRTDPTSPRATSMNRIHRRALLAHESARGGWRSALRDCDSTDRSCSMLTGAAESRRGLSKTRWSSARCDIAADVGSGSGSRCRSRGSSLAMQRQPSRWAPPGSSHRAVSQAESRGRATQPVEHPYKYSRDAVLRVRMIPQSTTSGMNPPVGGSLESLTVILRLSGLHHVRVAGIGERVVLKPYSRVSVTTPLG